MRQFNLATVLQQELTGKTLKTNLCFTCIQYDKNDLDPFGDTKISAAKIESVYTVGLKIGNGINTIN